MPVKTASEENLSLRCRQDTDGSWLLLAGRHIVAMFANRTEASDYARDLIERGLIEGVRFEDARLAGAD